MVTITPPSTTFSSPSPPSSSLFQTPNARWAALVARNPASYSSFVYAVLTTRICCRPTCSARLARRANVVFYDTYLEAAEAGFRACKRCRPDLEPGSQHEGERGRKAVAKAVKRITEMESGKAELAMRENGGEFKVRKTIGLRDLARDAGLTKAYFHKVFKKMTGVTPRIYAVNVRAERIVCEAEYRASASEKAMEIMGMTTPELVGSASLSVNEESDGIPTPGSLENENVAVEAINKASAWMEFVDLPSDTELEQETAYLHSEVAPTTTENRVFTKKIEYTIQPWASGFVLIAATNDGICWLEGGNSIPELHSSLAHEFPYAEREVSHWTGTGGFQNATYKMFATVMEGLLRPSGKVLNVPFDVI